MKLVSYGYPLDFSVLLCMYQGGSSCVLVFPDLAQANMYSAS